MKKNKKKWCIKLISQGISSVIKMIYLAYYHCWQNCSINLQDVPFLNSNHCFLFYLFFHCQFLCSVTLYLVHLWYMYYLSSLNLT